VEGVNRGGEVRGGVCDGVRNDVDTAFLEPQVLGIGNSEGVALILAGHSGDDIFENDVAFVNGFAVAHLVSDRAAAIDAGADFSQGRGRGSRLGRGRRSLAEGGSAETGAE